MMTKEFILEVGIQFNTKKNNRAVITVIQVYAPTTNAEETEVEWF